MRYLAIDYGNKHSGLAICDRDEKIVSPLTVVHGQQELLKKITDLVETENVDSIVFGLPLNMDNSQGFQAKLVLKFAEKLKNVIDIPVHFQDERLSTFAAEQKAATIEISKKKKRKFIDALAAADILQSFLNAKE